MRVRALARRIADDYRGREIHLVGVLHGAFVFMADLARHLRQPVTCDFLRAASYGNGTASSGRVRFSLEPVQPVAGRHVLLVEDIVDTGLTLSAVLDRLRRRRPASLRVCTLLRKTARVKVPVPVDYVGFEIPDHFVVGYGLDHAARWRNLPYIGLL